MKHNPRTRRPATLLTALFCLLPQLACSDRVHDDLVRARANPQGPGHVAAALAHRLGTPSHFLVGLGTQGSEDTVALVRAQNLHPEILDVYLVGVGNNDWTTWNTPRGSYVLQVAGKAESVGAVPMFTLYQMAALGDGNLAGLSDPAFMTPYWDNVRQMFQMIRRYAKPTLVNLEPDLWGYAQRQAPHGNPTALPVRVRINADCAQLPDDVTGMGQCLLLMARKYASNALVGFPPSNWGADSTGDVATFMSAIGAGNADFIVAQTSDRDVGCLEARNAAAGCIRKDPDSYWDEHNQQHPNFEDYLATWSVLRAGMGNLPLLWWQTPMGVPNAASGGTDFHYRDNREQYFLTHAAELVAIGGVGAVFSSGETHQTNLATDGGQFRRLSSAYRASPVALP